MTRSRTARSRPVHDVGIISAIHTPHIEDDYNNGLMCYLGHIEEVVRLWNEALAEQGLQTDDLHISFSAKAILMIGSNPETQHMLRGNYSISQFHKNQEGCVYRNQIRTTADIIRNVINSPGASGLCAGECLSGKTGICNNTSWLAPILYLLTGKWHYTVPLVPGKKGMESQTKGEQRGFISFYEGLEVTVNGRMITLKTYNSQLMAAVPRFSDVLADYGRTSQGDQGVAASLVRRSLGKNLKFINEFCTLANESAVRLIFLVDEPHWGAGMERKVIEGGEEKVKGRDSVQTMMLKESGIIDQIIKNLKELVTPTNFFIGYSATGWQLVNVVGWVVRCRIPPNYLGLNMFNGEVLDPEVECQAVEHWSYDKASLETGIDFLSLVNSSWYYFPSSYQKAQTKYKKYLEDPQRYTVPPPPCPEMSWDEYKVSCEEAIAQYLNWCLIDPNPRRGCGFLLRWFNNTGELNSFLARLRDHGLSEDILIELYDETNNSDGLSIREWIRRKNLRPDKPTIVCFTGSGRMGDNPPEWFRYGFEGANESSLTALRQCIYGRLGGVNKMLPGQAVPLILMSNTNAQNLDIYISRRGNPHKNPHQDTCLVDPVRRGAPKRSMTLGHEAIEGHALLMEAWAKTQQEVTRRLEETGGRLKGGVMPFFQWWSEREFSYIEENWMHLAQERFVSAPKLLRRREKDETNKGYYFHKTKPQLTKVGFRTANGPSSSNSNLPSDRFVPGGDERSDDPFRMEFQAHIFQGRLTAIRFRLKQAVKEGDIGSGRNVVMPRERTLANVFVQHGDSDVLES